MQQTSQYSRRIPIQWIDYLTMLSVENMEWKEKLTSRSKVIKIQVEMFECSGSLSYICWGRRTLVLSNIYISAQHSQSKAPMIWHSLAMHCICILYGSKYTFCNSFHMNATLTLAVFDVPIYSRIYPVRVSIIF